MKAKTQKEIFKDIPNYEGLYQVSNLGRVKSLKRNVICGGSFSGFKTVNERILKPSKTTHGYFKVGISINGKLKNIDVHRLMANTFLNNKENKNLVVDHIDNDKTNNNISNLQLITHRENCSKDRKNKTL